MFFFVLLVLTLHVSCETHALLISGIGAWDTMSYASEASTYHAYFDFVEGGVKPENIVLMSINDAVNNPKNPHPGEIGYYGGFNLWPYVKDHIDYEGKDVNHETLFDVMLGKETGKGSGRTLQTTEEDDLLIINMNHGALGHVVFNYEINASESNTSPLDNFDVLWALDTINVIKQMQKERKFRNLVWIMCSCFSGSFFNSAFGPDENVFIITSAPVDRSAYACDFSPELSMSTSCCIHQSWQKYLRFNAGQLDKKTLMDQYHFTYSQKVNLGASAVEEYCAYGNWEFAGKTPVSNFEGNLKKPATISSNNFNKPQKTFQKMQDFSPLKNFGKTTSEKNRNSIVTEHDPPFPGLIQFNYTGFDSDYVMCAPSAVMDFQCVKDFYSVCLSDKAIMPCCYQEGIDKVVRVGCSEGAKTDAATLQKMLRQYPCFNTTTNHL